MGNGILNLQGGMGSGLLSTLSSTLTNLKGNINSRLPTGGTASKILMQTDIVGPLSRGEKPKIPQLSKVGGGLGYANKPFSESFQPTPPGGNLILPSRGHMQTRSFRTPEDMPGNTRRF